jgi:hypothetical protein
MVSDVGTASLLPGLNVHSIVPEVALGSHVVLGHPSPPQRSVPSAKAGDAPATTQSAATVTTVKQSRGIR